MAEPVRFDDYVDPTDLDASVDRLLNLDEVTFDEVVKAYLRIGRGRGTEVLRHPDLVERTDEALVRLMARYERAKRKDSGATEESRAAARERFDQAAQERKVVRALAGRERHLRAMEEATRGPRHRAMVRLSKEYPERFVQLVREEKERDRALGRASSE